jgi:hypothetical protein
MNDISHIFSRRMIDQKRSNYTAGRGFPLPAAAGDPWLTDAKKTLRGDSELCARSRALPLPSAEPSPGGKKPVKTSGNGGCKV